MSIWTQKSASIQPRTSLSKFGRRFNSLFNPLLTSDGNRPAENPDRRKFSKPLRRALTKHPEEIHSQIVRIIVDSKMSTLARAASLHSAGASWRWSSSRSRQSPARLPCASSPLVARSAAPSAAIAIAARQPEATKN